MTTTSCSKCFPEQSRLSTLLPRVLVAFLQLGTHLQERACKLQWDYVLLTQIMHTLAHRLSVSSDQRHTFTF